jgi:hypothetical protein
MWTRRLTSSSLLSPSSGNDTTGPQEGKGHTSGFDFGGTPFMVQCFEKQRGLVILSYDVH